MSENSYDLIPYASYPFKQTHPNNLYTIATLFGMSPKEVSRSRVLELGSAAGGNIIPIAYQLPEANLTGIDLSEKQIEAGKAQVKELGLTNIELLHKSIMDVDDSFGTFDYIICHGVFSWVSAPVREKIFSVCRNNLTADGVACISYNTFPGWNFVRSFREMMIYHTSNFESLEEKAQQARALLQFIYEGVKAGTSPYADFLKSEIKLLSQKSDSYLIHEHLEENNQPFYFHEFVKQAQDAGLRYLADTPMAIMYHHNFPDKVTKELDKINDLVKIGQYMDYFRNQRFRTTLLCQKEAEVNRKLQVTDMERYYFSFNGSFKKEKDFEMRMDEGVKLSVSNKWATLTVSSSKSKHIIMTLLENKKKPLSFEQLCKKVMERCGIESLEKVKHYIHEEFGLLRLVLSGLIEIHSGPGFFTNILDEKPEVFSFAAYQARDHEVVTNIRHEIVRLNVFERILVQHLKGEKNLDEIFEAMCEHAYQGDLKIYDNALKKNLEEKEDINRNIKMLLDTALERFISYGMLVEKR